MAKTAQEKLDAKREKAYYKKHKKMYRTKPGDVIFNIFNYIFFSAFTFTCIFPFYYLFVYYNFNCTHELFILCNFTKYIFQSGLYGS